MENVATSLSEELPLWRRALDFPLVALVVATALFLLALAAGLKLGEAVPQIDPLARQAAQAAIIIALALATYKVAIVRLGERRRDDLPVRGAATGLGLGLVAGAALIGLVVVVAALFDVYNVVGEGSLDALPKTLIAAAILPGFMEELLFRGILFRWIEEFFGSWIALIGTSALFGLAHIGNPSATWFSSFAIAMEAGLLLGGAYMLTRSLWLPIGLHASWNFTQGAIFDVPVSGVDSEGWVDARLSGPELLSGGAFGLEASLIALVIATAAGTWLIVLAVRRGSYVAPWWVRRRTPDRL